MTTEPEAMNNPALVAAIRPRAIRGKLGHREMPSFIQQREVIPMPSL
jgi:hypothetical protein